MGESGGNSHKSPSLEKEEEGGGESEKGSVRQR